MDASGSLSGTLAESTSSCLDWRSWLTPVEAPSELVPVIRRGGVMGSNTLDTGYMPKISKRARGLRAACDQGREQRVDPRQLRLPGF